MKRRTILVTGSSGQLGSALVHALRDVHSVVQFDCREPTDSPQRDIGRLQLGSVVSPADVASAMEGVDTVIHCAAITSSIQPYHRVIETNVLGTFNVLEEAGRRRSVEQFIHVSSLTWHGLSEEYFERHTPDYLPVDEDHPSKAADYYSFSKVQAESWCEKYVQRFRKPVVVVRPSFIVRSADEAVFTARTPFQYPYLYDYIATSDLVDAIVRALDYDPPGGIDHLLVNAEDQGSTMPTLELIRKFYPGVMVDGHKLAAGGEFAALVDCSRAAERLGWRPYFRCRR